MTSKNVPCAVLCVTFLLARPLLAQSWTPPPPEVPPSVSQDYAGDLDGDRIDDALKVATADAVERGRRAAMKAEKRDVTDVATGMAAVELIFNAPITQEQIDAFLLVGGEIDYIYRAVSYGWPGRIPVDLVEALLLLVGETLVLVKGPNVTALHALLTENFQVITA